MVDHEALSRQLIRALRGVRSQGATNRRLHRSSNVCHTWERGTRHPTASDFLTLAALANIDVDRVLAEFGEPGSAQPAPLVPDGGSAVTRFLKRLARGRAHAPLARQIGRDRNTIARWLGGETEPRLPDLLRVVDSLSLRLVDFVAAFVDPERLPAVRAAHRDLVRQRQLAYEMPWAHAVLRVLELDAYRSRARHEPGFIARFIGIDLEEEARCLEALSQAGQIRRRDGKWKVQRVLVVDTREDPAGNISLKKHWARTGLERLERDGTDTGNLFSYNLFAISEEGLDEIRRAPLDYFARLRSIVAALNKSVVMKFF
jgi:transcriptional regulator with XRE-family HTH domain